MAELDLIRQYNARKDADFNAWISQPSQAPSASNPQPGKASAEPQGPPSPPAPGVWAQFYQFLADRVSERAEGARGAGAAISNTVSSLGGAALEAGSHTFSAAAKNVTEGVVKGVTGGRGIRGVGVSKREDGTPHVTQGINEGVSALGQIGQGAMELAMVLPAGIAAAITKALQMGGAADTVVIPGGPASAAGFIRTVLLTPQMILDPAMPRSPGLIAGLNDPMTSGELVNIVTMFLAGHGQVKALRGKQEPVGAQAPAEAALAAVEPAAAPAAPAGPVGGPTAPKTLADLQAARSGPATPPKPAPSPNAPPKTLADVRAGLSGNPPTPERPTPLLPERPVERFQQMAADPELTGWRDIYKPGPGPAPPPEPTLGPGAKRREANMTREQQRAAFRTPFDDQRGSLSLDAVAKAGEKIRDLADSGADVLRKIVRVTAEKGGATYDPRKRAFEQTDTGFAVAIAPDRGVVVDTLTPEVLATFIKDNADVLAKDPNARVGTWVNEGKTYLDISAVTKDRQTAMEIAQASDQKAIFDFSTMSDVPVDPKMLRLEHYSPQEGLTELDPKQFGAFGAGRESARASDPAFAPRSFAYTAGTVPEARFAGLNKYEAEVPAASVMDLASEQGRALAGQAGGDATRLEALVRENGFGGYRNSGLNVEGSDAKYAKTPGNIVALFDRTPVSGVAREPLAAAPAAGNVRLYRNGPGTIASADPATAPGKGALHFVDIPEAELAGSEIGNGQHYLFDQHGAKLSPFYGRIAEKQVPKVEAAKARLRAAYDKILADVTNEGGYVDLRGEITERLKKNGQVINDLGAVGAAVLWKGARDLKSFSREMVAEFGDVITPHLADVYAKSQETLAGLVDQAKYGLPKTKALLKLFREGEFGKEWYDKSWDELQRLFGVNAETYAKVLAATSPNNGVDGNVTMANLAMKQILTGERYAGPGGYFREGAGGFMPAHAQNLNRVLEGKELSGPKVGAFARALMGDVNAVVIDTWMQRAFGFSSTTAPEKKFHMSEGSAAFRFMQKTINDLAIDTGASPRQVQAAIWVAKKVRDEGLYDRVQNAALHSSDVAGRPIDQIVRAKLEGSDLAEVLRMDAEKAGEMDAFRGWDTGFQDAASGRAEVGTLLALTRMVIGGVAGAAMGGDLMSSATGVGIALGLGTDAARAAGLAVVKRLKSVDPEGAQFTSLTAGLDPTKLGDVFKNLVKRRSTSERDFNYERMDATTASKNLIRTLDQNIEAMKKFEPRSNEETKAMAAQSKYNNVSEILKLDDDTPLSGPDYLAARNVMNHVAEELIREATIGEDAMRVRDLTGVLGEVAARVKQVRTSIARAEQSGNIVSRETDISKFYDLDRVSKGIEATKAGLLELDDPQLMDAIKLMADRNKVTALARATRNLPSAFWEVYYGLNLLSSPWTHFRNMVGNTSAVAFGMADRLAGEIIATPFHTVGKGKDLVQLGETWDLAREMTLGVRNGLRAARKNWQTGESFLGSSSMSKATEGLETLSQLDPTVPGTMYGKFIDGMAAVARGNLRFMGATDEFYKYLNFAGELAAQARRQAAAEGLTGAAKVERMLELQQEPTTSMLAAAKAFAEEQTFTKDFDPQTLGGKVQAVARHPGARLTITPFFRTPMRLAEYANVHTPGLNLVAKQFWSDITPPSLGGSATPAKANLAFGKLAVGGGLVYAVAQLAQDGYITGNGPNDPALRKHMEDAGWQRQSIYNPFSGKYHSYASLDPITTPVSFMADMVQLGSELDDATYSDLFMSAVLAMSKDVGGKSYLQPISDLIDVVDGLSKEGSDGAARASLKLLANQTLKLVPGEGALRAVRQNTDDTMREPRTFLEYLANQTPGWSSSVRAKRNMVTGEPILYEGVFGQGAFVGGLSPWRVSTNKDDVALDAIVKQGGAGIPREMPRVIGGTKPSELLSKPLSAREGVLLDESQRARLTHLVTHQKDHFGLTLHQALTSLVTETGPYAFEQYKSQSEGKDNGKGIAIYGVWREFMQRAQETLLTEDTALADQVRRRQLERELGKLPPAIQQHVAPAMRGALR